jgi:hypothetical protein
MDNVKIRNVLFKFCINRLKIETVRYLKAYHYQYCTETNYANRVFVGLKMQMNDDKNDTCSSKFHLVDLAEYVRAKKKLRLKGRTSTMDYFVFGNVISASI